MTFFGVTLIISFVETMLAITAGVMTHTQSFVSPVKLFLVFQLLTVVAFFLCHDFLLKLYSSLTSFGGHVIIKSNNLPFFESRSFLVGPAGFEPATKEL